MERFTPAGVSRVMDGLRWLTRRRGGLNAPRRRRSVGVLVAAAAVALTLLVLGSDVRALSSTLVDIRDSRYLPPSLTVPVGTTVRWINHDEDIHTVNSTTGLFGSKGIDLDEEYSYTFTAPGVYPYTCDLHPRMNGTIVVN
jgi:plastocyanin